jgi:hypothetical protein
MPEPEPAIVTVVCEDLARDLMDATDEEIERVLVRGARAKIREDYPNATIIEVGDPTYDGDTMTINFKVFDPGFDRMTITVGPFKDKDNA